MDHGELCVAIQHWVRNEGVSYLARFPEVHSTMIEGVSCGKMLKDVVVRRQRGRGQLGTKDGVRRVVERVRGDEGAAVDVAGQHKLNLGYPFFHSLGLGL